MPENQQDGEEMENSMTEEALATPAPASTPAPAQDSWTKRLATDAMFLAVLSGIGYWIAYAYETGYASHFGYPVFLIYPSLTTIIVSFGALAGVVMALAPLLLDAFRTDARARNLAINLLFLALVALGVLYVIFSNNYNWKAVLRQIAPGVTIYFLNRWTAKLQDKGGSSGNPKASVAYLLLFLALVLSGISNLSGLMAAKEQKVFYFLTSKPDYAAVRVYDGMTVAVRFNAQTNSFTGDYLVLKLGDEPKELGLKRIALTAPRLPVLKSGEP